MTELKQPASQRVADRSARKLLSKYLRKRLRIGIFGTGGNPWTTSHKILAEQARVQFDLDIVYLVTPNVGVDKELADKEMRWDLTLDAASNNDGFVASRVELDREGKSYMSDTLKVFRRMHPGAELYLIIGEDRAPTIKTWHAPRTVVRMAKILVGPRYGCEPKVNDKWLQEVLPPGARFGAIEIEYSATWIRKRLAMGKSVRYMIGDAEIRTILRHGGFGTREAAAREAQRKTRSK